jgi:hypothetical protein
MTYQVSRRGLLRGGVLASGLVLGAPLLAACGNDNSSAPAKAGTIGPGSLRLYWVKDVEFAGSYIADTDGYYKAAGFSSFELIGGGPTATPVETGHSPRRTPSRCCRWPASRSGPPGT